MGALFVYIVCRDRDEARRIGRTLVEERLAACVNIPGEIESLYWWEGSLTEDLECALIAKTMEDAFPTLEARVRSLHSYTCPCIAALPISQASPAYLAWLRQETQPS